jgi:hypothetical protein
MESNTKQFDMNKRIEEINKNLKFSLERNPDDNSIFGFDKELFFKITENKGKWSYFIAKWKKDEKDTIIIDDVKQFEVSSKSEPWVIDQKRDKDIISGLKTRFDTNKDEAQKIVNELSAALRKFKKETTKPEEELKFLEHITLKGVIDTFHKWLSFKDEEFFEIPLAVGLSNYLPGERLWLMLVTPPSGSKTEILRAYGNIPNEFVHQVSMITDHTFISGLKENIDLAPRIHGKILIIKDFTTILQMKEDTRKSIFAQIREIYDGYIALESGSGIGTKQYPCAITIIGGVTPIIDSYFGFASSLGERFLYLRDRNVNRDEILKGAVANSGKEKEMRSEISMAVLSFIKLSKERIVPNNLPKIPEDKLDSIKMLADVVAVLRTNIPRNYKQETTYKPTPEYPTRLMKQLMKLAVSLAIVRGHTEITDQDIDSVKWVAFDSVEARRIDMLKLIETTTRTGFKKSLENYEISERIKLDVNTVRTICEDLQMLNFLTFEKDKQGHFNWKLNKIDPVCQKYLKMKEVPEGFRKPEEPTEEKVEKTESGMIVI